MTENYLLTGSTKKKFRKGTKLFYFNKFSQLPSALKKIHNNCKVSNLENINKTSFPSKKDTIFIKKKVSIYLSQLSHKLNNIHNSKFDENYWGLLLENYLFYITSEIYFNQKILEKNKRKFKSFKFIKETIKLKKNSSLKFFFDEIVEDYNFSKFIKSKIILNNFKVNKKIYNYRFLEKSLPETKKNLLIYFFNIFIRVYIKIFKPVIIVNPYFGKKNSIEIIIRSFGRILICDRNNLFPEFLNKFNKDKKSRLALVVNEKDILDKTFNSVNKEFFPASFLENYKIYSKSISNIKRYIKIFGNAVTLFSDDYCKILAGHIKLLNGRLINFQHGGGYGKLKFDITDYFQKKYCDKIFYWHQKNYLGNTYLPKIKKFKKKVADAKKILILTTQKKFSDNLNMVLHRHLNKKYYPFHASNFIFYKKLKSNLKKLTLIKLFPDSNSKNNKKIWKQKISQKLKIFSSGSFFKKKFFQNTRIIILDDISTPLFEAIYLNTPTILICNEINEFDKRFQSKIRKLKKLNFYFTDAQKASTFINDNYDSINIWWNKVKKSNDFKKFKNELFFDKGFNPHNSLTKEILKNR